MAAMNEQFDAIQQALYNAEYDDFVMDSLKFAVSSLLKVAITQQARIEKLERQVARLVEATPSAGERLPPDWIENIMAQDARRVARHKRDFEEVARLKKKTVAQVERDLCKRDQWTR